MTTPAPEEAAAAAPASTPGGDADEPQSTEAAIAARREEMAKQPDQEGKTAGDMAVSEEEATTDDSAPEPEQGEEEETVAEEETGDDEGVEEEEADPAFEVELPGMDERGEQPITLTAPDQESYDRLNRLNNEAQVGREFRGREKDLDARHTELEQVEDMIQIDPVGFVSQFLPGEYHADIALQLLMEPNILAAVEDRLQARPEPISLSDVLTDPGSLRLLQAETARDRLTQVRQFEQRVQGRRAEAERFNSLKQAVTDLIPETVTGRQRDLLYRDALRDLHDRQTRNRQHNAAPLGVKDIPFVLRERFAAHGIDVFAAQAPAKKDGNGAGPAAGKKRAPASRTGAEYTAARTARRTAAAAAPAGAGAPAAPAREPLATDASTSGVIEKLKAGGQGSLRKMLGRA